MTHHSVRLILLICAFIPAPLLAGGGMASGGGDARTMYFKNGRNQAIQILTSLVPGNLLESNDPVRKEAAQYLKSHASELSTEVAASPIEWQDGQHPGSEKCARTTLGVKGAPIHLSFARCLTVSSAADAGRLLVHEAVHHLAPERSEEFADAVAMIAFESWENLLTRRIPLCNDSHLARIRDRDSVEWTETLSQAQASALRKRGYAVIWTHEDTALLGHWQASIQVGKSRASFTQDHSVLENLPGIGACARTAGWAVLPRRDKSVRIAFALMTLSDANNHIVYFEKQEDSWNIDSHKVRLVRTSEKPKDDILYIGGDFSEPFTALRRRNE